MANKKKKTRDITFRNGRVYFKGEIGAKIDLMCQLQKITPQQWFDRYFHKIVKEYVKEN